MRRQAALVAAAAFFAWAPAADAVTIPVTKEADTNGTCLPGDCSLREAVKAAEVATDPDVIEVPAGTYTLSLGTLPVITRELAIQRAGGGTATITGSVVNGGGGAMAVGAIHHNGSSLTLTDLTITGNSATNASTVVGGIANASGPLTLIRTAVNGNTATTPATFGTGGVQSPSTGQLALDRSSVSGNIVSGDPTIATAGINAPSRPVRLIDSAVDGNTLAGTVTIGVAGLDAGALVAERSSISGNTVSATATIGTAGFRASTASLTDTVVRNNQVTATGTVRTGAGVVNAALTMSGSTVAGNRVTGNGTSTVAGLIYQPGGGPPPPVGTVVNSTISDNSATSTTGTASGGLRNSSGDLRLTNVTLTGNSVSGAGGSGGNLRTQGMDATTTLRSSIVSAGIAAAGANCSGPTVSAGNNLESADTCALGPAELRNTDPLLGPLADNGGLTSTHAITQASPAFNAGANAGCPATDQRGIPRPQFGICDIGAFEILAPPPPAPPAGTAAIPGSPADLEPPLARGLRVVPSSVRAAASGESVTAAQRKKRRPKKTGARVSYTLSEPAEVTFTVERSQPGRRVKRKCVAAKRKHRRRPACRRVVAVRGSFSHRGAEGTNAFRFTGRVGGRRLRPGRYELIGVPVDAVGNRGTAVRAKFRIVR